jgi:hypothetical protein
MTADQAYACIFLATFLLPIAAWVLERGNGGRLPGRSAALTIGALGAAAMLTPVIAEASALGLPLVALAAAWVVLPLRAERQGATCWWKLALLMLPTMLIGLPNAIYLAMAG